MFFFLLAFVCSLFSLAFALPVVPPVTRDVWAPSITSPNASTTWVAGGTYTVTWDTSTQPSQITNPNGVIYLRYANVTQLTPLAQGFLLTAGEVDMTVPADIQPSNDWILVLMGDSGDWSQPFTILAPPS